MIPYLKKKLIIQWGVFQHTMGIKLKMTFQVMIFHMCNLQPIMIFLEIITSDIFFLRELQMNYPTSPTDGDLLMDHTDR